MKLISLLVLFTFVTMVSSGARSSQVRTAAIDFDKTADGKELDVSLTGRLVANGYLAAFDITLSDLTPGTQVVVHDLRNFYSGQAIKAVSGNNGLSQIGSNDAVSFTMNFKTPLQSVKFMRPSLIAGPTGITFPRWKASALDAKGQTLTTAEEPQAGYYSDTPAKQFVLTGPGIKAIRFDSDSRHFTAFSSVVLDDLTLVP